MAQERALYQPRGVGWGGSFNILLRLCLHTTVGPEAHDVGQGRWGSPSPGMTLEVMAVLPIWPVEDPVFCPVKGRKSEGKMESQTRMSISRITSLLMTLLLVTSILPGFPSEAQNMRLPVVLTTRVP